MEPKIQFPHCDPRILHSPGTCEHCDQSGLQELRQTWNIAFTNQPEEGKYPCPAEAARGAEAINKWGGNRAKPSLESVVEHMTRHNRPAQLGAAMDLVELLKDLSEEIFAASWLIDWEYIVWDDVHDQPRSPSRRIDKETRAKILHLSEVAGGWIYMPDDLTATGPRFISMDAWLERLKKRKAYGHADQG